MRREHEYALLVANKSLVYLSAIKIRRDAWIVSGHNRLLNHRWKLAVKDNPLKLVSLPVGDGVNPIRGVVVYWGNIPAVVRAAVYARIRRDYEAGGRYEPVQTNLFTYWNERGIDC